MKKFSLVLSLVLFTMGFAFAQRTVVGQITDDDGAPLIGATVLVKGTDSGTVTDIDGKYSVNVPEGASMLELSYTGYETQEIALGVSNVVNVALSEGVTLETAVVTALGVKRSEKALGYSVQQVGGEDIGRSGASNAVDALVGKAAGIQVTRSSGTAGGGSRILIRGVTSMVGENQPLIVIDGVRTNNETQTSQASTAGVAVSNRLMDLNPDDIESINVLKGAAATALYGTSGSTGVILITTKKGNKGEKFSVDFSSSVGFDNITTMVDLQNEYAQGWSGGYDDPSTGSSTSWGPRMSDLEYSKDMNHPNAPGAGAFFADGTYRFDPNGFIVPKGTGNGQAANVYDNVTPFFQTGNTFNNSVAISGGTESATVRLSVSDRRENGVIPNNEYDRQTVKLSSSLSPTKDFTISGSVNYSKSEYVKIQQGSNTSGLLLGMLRTPVSFDNTGGLGADAAIDNSAAYLFPDARQRNYRGGGGYDNPYWTINLAKGYEDVDRVFGNLKLDYQIDPWLNIGINSGYDIASDVRKQEFEIGSRTNAAGRILHDDFKTKVFDNYLNFTGNGNLTDDITFSYLAGANAFSFNSSQNFATGDGLVFPGFLDMSNATQVTGGNDIERYRTVGFIGQVEAGFQNMLYLTLSARQDYDSRLGNPTDFNLSNTGFFYPSASLAWVFSEVLGSNDAFSFGKLRLSWAQVGSPPPNPYSTSSVFGPFAVGDGWGDDINFPIAGQTGFDNSSLLGNPNLTPELSTTFEIGADLRFLRNRLGLDVTYYNRKTVDAILNASLARSTGYANVWLNSGEMTSNGIEVTLNATPVSNKNFQWNSQVNFTKSESIVDKLAPGIERLFLAGFNTAGTYLVEGNQYGAIFGGAYLREGAGTDDDTSLNIPPGAVVITDDPDSPEYGYQAVDPVQRAIGNPNPDFIIGWNNVLSYKRLTANFLLDWREGGDLWNGTAWALSFFGRSQLTAETREETATPIEGVKSDGSANDIPVVRDQGYWTSSVGGFGAVGEQFVQDGGWVRLREVGVSYRLPDYGRLRGGSLGVSGRNLWYQSDYNGIDPETSLTGTGNGQGFDYFNMPSTRSVIVTLNLNF